MSTFLQVRLVEIRLPEEQVEPLLRRIQSACAPNVPHNLLVQLRFNRVVTSQGTDLEPFISGASVLALYGQRRKRDYMARLLRAIVEAAFQLAENVDLRLETADGSEPEGVVHEVSATLDEVFALRRLPRATVFRLTRPQ